MKLSSFLIFFSLLAIGCQSNKKNFSSHSASIKDTVASRKFSQIKIKADYNTATVGIDSFTLITNIREAQIEDAKAIMRAKVILPLAMQKHDAALFDSVLAKNFILKGGMNFSREKLLYEIALKGNG